MDGLFILFIDDGIGGEQIENKNYFVLYRNERTKFLNTFSFGSKRQSSRIFSKHDEYFKQERIFSTKTTEAKHKCIKKEKEEEEEEEEEEKEEERKEQKRSFPSLPFVHVRCAPLRRINENPRTFPITRISTLRSTFHYSPISLLFLSSTAKVYQEEEGEEEEEEEEEEDEEEEEEEEEEEKVEDFLVIIVDHKMLGENGE
ncbi:hypothetical protein V1478_012524 [Vespula squamosa]|uniref:Uncharacterized protein n=1 Tax=Vespula squamosa TaxID=30214 RepID=A0ABD2ADG3_VESSQ